MKIRINDLARELEVKSKAILDVLEEVGITEKKTHSSSVEPDEAEKIRKYFAAKSSSSSRERTASPEIKPKIDLSKISKPGDVARLLKQRQQEMEHPAPPPRPATVVKSPVQPAAPAKPQVQPPVAAQPPAAPTVEKSAPKPPAPVERPIVVPAPRQAPPIVAPPPQPPAQEKVEKPAAPPATVVAPPPAQVQQPPAVVVTPPKAPVPPAATTSEPAPPATAKPPAPPASAATPPKPTPGQPIVPQRRMITPQTGPRPVYTAPPPSPTQSQPRPQFHGQPGRPMQGARPQGGVVRGQPIFQRPRPAGPGGAPGSRPPFGRPGDQRRGPHPTSAARTGFPPRPGMGGAPGLPPPGMPAKPAGRPGAPSRRPGQRYQHGPKEGPMKGFTPPPRLAVSNEPLPITRSITITEGVSVKDLAEKLGVRAKDLIARLLMKGVMATVNQSPGLRTGQRPGTSLRG
jgi:translation initiation factor IF-2